MMKSDVIQSLKATHFKLSFSISPLTRWILTILVLGVGVIVVLFLYSQEQSRNAELQDDVDGAAATLVQNSLARRDLEGKLATANLELAELQALVPSSGQTMTVEEALYAAAADAGVEISTVSVSTPRGSAQGEADYQSLGVTVSVTGLPMNQLRFIGVLGHWLPSADIESTSLSAESVSLAMSVYVL